MIRMQIIGVTVHSANFIPDEHPAWRLRSHSNPHWQLILAQGSDLHFQRENARLLMGHGQMLILHPNEVHSS